MIITLLGVVLFIGLGIVFANGKGSFLIAGYNTLPPEEKEKYDTVALCKFMGKMMFSLSFCMVLWAVSEAYDVNWLFYIGLALFIAIVVFMLIYVNTGNRFRK
ncbi:DUF3784 domain-containing protein [Sporosarcina ureilytica]|uniref:DUF3784 domain-containing protein n=1 Tax=Sporosarcina ureilytica TaxID=298596 RepID=A0A1D8JDD1_9BACL|nr:DUF3784 domain-containing protein [Sporosarcina ureilytica]AOV06717.1 hypothetical protein BI350_03305 [Sporosarcina ureilytica]